MLPAASLLQAYEEGFTAERALHDFLDRHGQRCSQLIDLNVPHPDLKVALSLQGRASFEDVAERDVVLAALEDAKTSYQAGDIPVLFAVSPVQFEYRINYVPSRQVRCITPEEAEPTS